MFSELIFEGKIGNLKIGESIINLKLSLETITGEDGDIPSLHNYNFDNEDFQITTLKGTIIGILHDFEYNQNKTHILKVKNDTFKIGFFTSFNEFIIFIKNNNVEHEIDYSDLNSADILIKKSGINLKFVNTGFSNLCKIWNFDWKLYEMLCKEINS